VHPIYARRGRLGLYLIGWVPAVALLTLLLGRSGLGWGEALALGLPLVLVYAYLSLAAWYVCQLAPLRPLRLLRLLGLQLSGAVLSSALWVLFGWGWAAVLGWLPAFPGEAARYLEQVPQLFALGIPLYWLAAAVHYLIAALEASQEAERRGLELTVLAREAELRALKAQLDPHFLFNSLNTISALTGSDPAGARKMSILLSEFLRRSLRLGIRETIPLSEELALTASYLAVERIRFGEGLRIDEEVEEGARACRVPSLLLQPLVENAVRHGLAQLLDGGAIRIEARRQEGRLRLAVANPCDPDHPPMRGEGVGLSNVAARLAAVYGGAARQEVASPPGQFRVTLDLPLKGEMDVQPV
jgi:signal transduction histidine kinase